MYILEYAQYRSGRFIGWVDCGEDFDSRIDAVEFARIRGLEHEGEDFLITEAFASRNPSEVMLLTLASAW
jgi:hypothetical protein